MIELQTDLNALSPQLLARFDKVRGAPEKLQVDDEFLIHIAGPWNGPVRVMEVTESGFKLATLEGHMEAGEIVFNVGTKNTKAVFEIESVARSRDVVVDLFYDKIAVAKFAQTEMWTNYCTNFAEKVLGNKDQIPQTCGDVSILTERQNESGQWETI